MQVRQFTFAFALASFLVGSMHAQTKQAAPLKVLASNGIRAVFESVKPQAEQAIGRKIVVEFATSSSLKTRIEKGEALDAAVLVTDPLDALVKSGSLDKASVTLLAKSGVGVGVKKGAKKPDVKTPEAMKQTLLKAKNVTYATAGASRTSIEKMFATMGIEQQMKPKLALEPGSVEAGADVAAGKTEIILTLASEIIPEPGLDFVGLLPAQYQGYVTIGAAVSPKASQKDAAAALIKFLASPAANAALKANGMERP